MARPHTVLAGGTDFYPARVGRAVDEDVLDIGGIDVLRGITAGQFAVSWVLNNALVSAVIGGPRTEEQWNDYLGALDYRFTAEDEALVDGLVVSGHPSTPGYNDPQYPIEGRPTRTRQVRG